jgi:hypothetical protein
MFTDFGLEKRLIRALANYLRSRIPRKAEPYLNVSTSFGYKMQRRCLTTFHFSACNWTTGSNSCRCSKKEVWIWIKFVDVCSRGNRRIGRNQRFTDVHPCNARNRLRRQISSLDTSLVRFGRRSTPLDYWKVFLLRVRDDVVGVFGTLRATRRG